MEGNYPIYHGTQQVGQANITRRGLYYQFDCRLWLSGEVVFRLQVCCGDIVESLGIPVPEGSAFVLRKMLPANRFGREKPIFRILPKHELLEETFIPLRPEEPFAYLSRLQNAYLQRRGDQLGIVLRENRHE